MYLFFSSDNKNNKFSTSIKPFLIFSFISLVCARSMSVQEETPASPGTNQDDHLGVLIPCTIIGGILFMAMLIWLSCYCKTKFRQEEPNATTPKV